MTGSDTQRSKEKEPISMMEADIHGGSEKKNDELVIEIREMVKRPNPEIEPSNQCRIYKVPHPLRKWNEEAYTPQVVSIGPFHHKNERLKAMEEHKERHFKSFVERSGIDVEYLVGEIRKMEKSIRECYDETIDLTSDRFVKMVLVDASFILELFIRFKESSGSSTSDDPIFVQPRFSSIKIDLLLLENQLPFFVIEKVHHLAFPSTSDDNALLKLSCVYYSHLKDSYFKRSTPVHSKQAHSEKAQANSEQAQAHSNVKIEHFTDLIRTFQLPPLKNLPKRDCPRINHLYSATQLHEAGVKFEVIMSGYCVDIKFENGVLKIPIIELDDLTEVVVRNIMALEQTRYIKNSYLTDYFILLDLLINTRKDVDLLCDKKILVNYLGDHNSVKSMINNLNKDIAWSMSRGDYFKLCERLNGFYENPWHDRKATLKREYFSTPWRTASTVAAIILLVLTFIQTTCSIIPLV
ncbi:hypothetical protein ACJW31_04G027700 [Castanea mollissima]